MPVSISWLFMSIKFEDLFPDEFPYKRGFLKKNDSIKIVHGPYELYCTSLQNMQKVTPDDYKHDRYE